MNSVMKISTFIHILNGRVWDAYHKCFLDLSSDDKEFILRNKEGIIDVNIPSHLVELGIVTTFEKERKLLNELKQLTRDRQFQSLYLITSTACNLDCDYCFYRSSISKSLLHRENMKFDIAKKAMDDFKRIVSGNVKGSDYWQQITFYGGEPLLNKELLYKAIPYSRSVFDSDTNIVINTNATLLQPQDIELFKDYDVEVQVSLDGDKEKHDLHRKTLNGDPSYEIVMTNIKRLLDKGVRVLPMITATDDNISNFSERVYRIINELNISDYAVNVLITDSFKTNDKYTELLAQEMLNAYYKFGDKAVDYAFVELYKRLLGEDKTISRNSCGSSRKITVFPNGHIYACQAMEKIDVNNMGIISDDYSNDDNWECWRDRSRFSNEECINCECVMSCGGGCATGSYNRTNSIYGLDYNNCEYTRKLFKKIHSV